MQRIGIIGAGFMGHTHAEVYKLLSLSEKVRLTGIADIDKSKALKSAKKSGAEIFESAEELIKNDNIDVIDICLPTYMHFDYAKMAVAAGKSIFIEKPVVLTPKQGEELLEIQKKYSVKIMVGQCLRHWDEYIYLADAIKDGKYGKLKQLVMKRLSPMPQWGFENWYADPSKSGGAPLDLHIHDVDFMRYILGEPETINTRFNNNHIFALFGYKSGITVQAEGGWDLPSCYPVESGYRADFENAILVFTGSGVSVYESNGRQHRIEKPSPSDGTDHVAVSIARLGGYYNELKYFITCLENNLEIKTAPLSEGVKTIKLIHKELHNV